LSLNRSAGSEPRLEPTDSKSAVPHNEVAMRAQVTIQLWYQTLSIGIEYNCFQALHEVGDVLSSCGDASSEHDDFYGINDVRCTDVPKATRMTTGIGMAWHGRAVQDREKPPAYACRRGEQGFHGLTLSPLYRDSPPVSSRSQNLSNPSDCSLCVASPVAVRPLCEWDHVIGEWRHVFGWCMWYVPMSVLYV